MPTRRQRILELLKQGEWTFDELRRELGVPVAVLAEDLRHVEKSARRGSSSLSRTPARCEACGHAFGERPGRFTTPGRCPRCKSERIFPPRLSL